MAFVAESRTSTFIARWQNSGEAERANYALYLTLLWR